MGCLHSSGAVLEITLDSDWSWPHVSSSMASSVVLAALLNHNPRVTHTSPSTTATLSLNHTHHPALQPQRPWITHITQHYSHTIPESHTSPSTIDTPSQNHTHTHHPELQPRCPWITHITQSYSHTVPESHTHLTQHYSHVVPESHTLPRATATPSLNHTITHTHTHTHTHHPDL